MNQNNMTQEGGFLRSRMNQKGEKVMAVICTLLGIVALGFGVFFFLKVEGDSPITIIAVVLFAFGLVLLLIGIITFKNSGNVEKSRAYKQLVKRYNFGSFQEFENFDTVVTNEVNAQTRLAYDKVGMFQGLVLTPTFLILNSEDIPNVLEAAKVLLVSCQIRVVHSRYTTSTYYEIHVFTTDEKYMFNTNDKMQQQTIATSLALELQALFSPETQPYELPYRKSRSTFIADATREAKILYQNKDSILKTAREISVSMQTGAQPGQGQIPANAPGVVEQPVSSPAMPLAPDTTVMTDTPAPTSENSEGGRVSPPPFPPSDVK